MSMSGPVMCIQCAPHHRGVTMWHSSYFVSCSDLSVARRVASLDLGASNGMYGPYMHIFRSGRPGDNLVMLFAGTVSLT
ncbi:hypothetical protein N7510_005399 [Penicillium lagena]|uniref:uncharacterized protein n=1 Tax=Penicillium lagena TaxID=94218 RepID=UPI002541FFC4|nr:uncharacterized protein N7510_005399 [Penicillium lagena]KAJ5612205.1 hypothetical protein N7510_005399 [Penicillium lagena]